MALETNGSFSLDGMNRMIARNWWAFVIRGILAILFGLIALLRPGTAMLSLALVFSAYLIVDGVFGIIAAIRAGSHHERWGWLLAAGIVNIAMGLIAASFPGAAILAFVFVTAAWALISGGLMLAAAFRLHISHGRWLLALGGIVSILWSVILVISPLLGAVVLTWWLGAYAVVLGVLLLLLAFRLRGQHSAQST